MMRILNMIGALAVAFLLTMPATAKSKVEQKPIYIFGYAISTVDSVIYITDVQRLDTAYVESSTKFLTGRSVYSSQLQDFLTETYGAKNAICSVFFSPKRSKLVKTFDQVSVRAKNSDDYQLCFLGNQVMAFHTVEWTPSSYEVEAGVEGPKVKSKKKKK